MECKLERNKTEPTATHHPPCAPSHSNWPTGIWDKRVTSYLFVVKRLMAVNYSSTEAKLASHRRYMYLHEPKWLRTDFSSGSSLDKPVPAHSNRNQTNSESTPGNPVCTPSESNRTPSIFRATPSTLRLKPSELRVFCGQLRYHSE